MKENKNQNFFLDNTEEDSGISIKKLNEYIHVGSAGGFILIGALIIAIVSLLLWGFTGTIPVTMTEIGIVMETETESHSCVCFVDVELNTGVIEEGKPANVRMPDGRTFTGTMEYFSVMPYSAEELKNMFSPDNRDDTDDASFSDWMMDKVLDGCSYAYLMTVETEEDISDYWHQVVQATVVIDEVRPISFLLQ